ncbi:MAG: AEC family transporter [Spirochaetes bacterium]|nr:AEC family transporter [Spirochaetota bacterium]
MQLVYNAIQGVLTILFMVAVGYGLSKRGWFDQRDSAFLTRLVLNLALPALMVSNFTRTFDRKTLLQIGSGIVIPLSVILGSYLVAAFVAVLLRIPDRLRGTFRALFAFSNTIFVGLPVNLALFGESAVPFVTLYYLVNTTLFWTLGVYYIRRDAEGPAKHTRFFSLETLRRVFSPVLVSFMIAILLVLMEVKLPPFLSASFKYGAELTTPLSMLIIGITMASIGFRGIQFDRYTIAILAGRFLVAPSIAWFALSRFPMPELMGKVFLVSASLPVMTQVAIVSKAFGADDGRASALVTLTTVLSLGVIPFYMFLLTL